MAIFEYRIYKEVYNDKFENICNEDIKIFDLDITNYDNVKNIFDLVQPDCVFHLAAQSSVAVSWNNPQLTISVNVIGTTNILEVIRNYHQNSKILLVGSSEEYGEIDYNKPVCETENLNPKNMYAVTKAMSEQIGRIYSKAYGIKVFMTRSFNHIGPHQSTQFVVSDFCSQIVSIENGKKPPVIKVGNLSAKRDFTDVRDIVRAYRMIVAKGTPGEVYNVGSGRAIEIAQILDIIISKSKGKVSIEKDLNRFRPIDTPLIVADINKITTLGWSPSISISTTIDDILYSLRN